MNNGKAYSTPLCKARGYIEDIPAMSDKTLRNCCRLRIANANRPILIRIKVNNGESFEVATRANTLVGHLKNHVPKYYTLGGKFHDILYRGFHLKEKYTLEDYKITTGDELTVVLVLPVP